VGNEAVSPAAWRSAVTRLSGVGLEVSCVVDVDDPSLQSVRAAVTPLGGAIAIRLTARHFLDGPVAAAGVFRPGGVANVDVVLETGDENPVPAAEAIALVGMVARLPRPATWRSVTVLAPDNWTEPPPSGGEQFTPSTAWSTLAAISRHVRTYGTRFCFGTDIGNAWSDMTFPYAVAGGYWLFVRRSALELACAVVTHPQFCGRQFSRGDEWLDATASRRPTDTTDAQVRWAATNHHIALWSDALAAPDRVKTLSSAR
jgi:hypothetical protein